MWATIWVTVTEWVLARTAAFWLACAFGGLCWVGGCSCERHRPHWFGKAPTESPEPPLAPEDHR